MSERVSDSCLRCSFRLVGDEGLGIALQARLQVFGANLAIFAEDDGKGSSNVRGSLKGKV